jgi:hypothetical protein
MAIFGFIFQVVPSLQRRSEGELRRKATWGGIAGLLFGLGGIALSANFGS